MTLYKHVRSKEELLCRMFARTIRSFRSGLRHIVEQPLPADEKLRRVIRYQVTQVATQLPLLRVFFSEEGSLPAAMARRVAREKREYDGAIERVVGEGIAEGRVRKVLSELEGPELFALEERVRASPRRGEPATRAPRHAWPTRSPPSPGAGSGDPGPQIHSGDHVSVGGGRRPAGARPRAAAPFIVRSAGRQARAGPRRARAERARIASAMAPSKSRPDPFDVPPPGPFQGIRPINVLHLKEILDRVYFGSVVVDDKGIITFLSQPYADFLGVDRDAVIGRHVTEVIENTRMHIVVQIGEVEIGRQHIRGEDLVVQRVPIRGETGRVVGAFGQVMFRVEELHDLVRRLKILESKVAYYEQELHSLRASRYTFDDIVGESLALKEAKRLALRAARSMSSVLLVGETGVGKELFAHAIHHASPRSRRPLVRVNCAAIPRELVEAELFGHEPGAFTGASKRGKPGKFELADGGSLFLDEIADMKLDVQANVLRALQEKEVERIGGTDPIKVDFRLLAATHEDLEALVAEGRFRADLFYRLNVVPIRIPPLRERREDVPALVSHTLCRLSEDMGRSPVRVTAAAMSALQGHDWPGNVRELVNVLERILNALEGDVIDVTHLPFVSAKPTSAVRDADVGRLRRLLREHGDLAIRQALALTRGNKTEAARVLGIHRASLYRKLSRES